MLSAINFTWCFDLTILTELTEGASVAFHVVGFGVVVIAVTSRVLQPGIWGPNIVATPVVLSSSLKSFSGRKRNGFSPLG